MKNSPSWIKWVQYLSYVHWGWNLQLRVQFGNLSASDCSPTLAADARAAGMSRGAAGGDSGAMGNATIAGLSDSASCTELLQASGVFPTTDLMGSPAVDVAVLLAFVFGLRIITYYCLRYTSSFRHPK